MGGRGGGPGRTASRPHILDLFFSFPTKFSPAAEPDDRAVAGVSSKHFEFCCGYRAVGQYHGSTNSEIAFWVSMPLGGINKLSRQVSIDLNFPRTTHKRQKRRDASPPIHRVGGAGNPISKLCGRGYSHPNLVQLRAGSSGGLFAMEL